MHGSKQIYILRCPVCISIRRPEYTEPTGRHKCSCQDNIKVYLKEIGCECVDWIYLTQENDQRRTLLSTVMNIRISQTAGNFFSRRVATDFSRRNLPQPVSRSKQRKLNINHAVLLAEEEHSSMRFNLLRLNFFYIIYINPVRTSQEAHYVFATKPNRLMLFGERVAVYCENHTEHTHTLCGQNASK
jgi:hypothetical protein